MLASVGSVLPTSAQTRKRTTSTAPGLKQVEHFSIRGEEFDMHLAKKGWIDVFEGRVSAEHDFYIGKTEVTQRLWENVMGYNPSANKAPQHPVENISWMDCQRFIIKLNQLTGKYFYLPTVQEWEYVQNGANLGYKPGIELKDVTWHAGNSGGVVHDVATKQSRDKIDVYDMMGNVQEWCYNSGYDGTTIHRAISGCSVEHDLETQEEYAGCGSDFTNIISFTSPFIGMRLALNPNPKVIIPNGVYFISSEANPELVFDNTGYNVEEFNNVQIWHRMVETNKMWRVVNHGDGSISILSMQNDFYVVTLRDGACVDRQNIVINTYNGTESQRWMPKKTASGNYILQNCYDHNYVIAVSDNNINPESNVELRHIGQSPGGHTWRFTSI